MSSNNRILVVGGTGMLGEPVTRQLQIDGFDVRILSRSPQKAIIKFGEDFEIMEGDIQDRTSLSRALEGCIGVHINLKGGPTPKDYDRIEHQGTQAVVHAAKQAQVRQITYLSGYTIQEKNALSPSTIAKFKAEQAIRASGIPYTIFRATWFFESLPEFVQGKWGLVIGKQPHPLHWLAASDYAKMVSRSHLTPDALNKELYIYGPQAFTMAEALKVYCSTVIPSVRVATIPTWLLSLVGMITFDVELQSIVELLVYYDKIGEEGDPREANELLGTPTTTLQQWCEEHRQTLIDASKQNDK
ncbi:MAG: NAD(P)H-binding protein [Chloroflexi bacterium]|nr:NAD(P)H-binding protein [Chloroflexota bacterium]